MKLLTAALLLLFIAMCLASAEGKGLFGFFLLFVFFPAYSYLNFSPGIASPLFFDSFPETSEEGLAVPCMSGR